MASSGFSKVSLTLEECNNEEIKLLSYYRNLRQKLLVSPDICILTLGGVTSTGQHQLVTEHIHFQRLRTKDEEIMFNGSQHLQMGFPYMSFDEMSRNLGATLNCATTTSTTPVQQTLTKSSETTPNPIIPVENAISNVYLPDLGGDLSDLNPEALNSVREVPDSNGEVSDSNGEVPESNGEVPESSGELPDSNREVPDLSREVPNPGAHVVISSSEINNTATNFNYVHLAEKVYIEENSVEYSDTDEAEEINSNPGTPQLSDIENDTEERNTGSKRPSPPFLAGGKCPRRELVGNHSFKLANSGIPLIISRIKPTRTFGNVPFPDARKQQLPDIGYKIGLYKISRQSKITQVKINTVYYYCTEFIGKKYPELEKSDQKALLKCATWSAFRIHDYTFIAKVFGAGPSTLKRRLSNLLIDVDEIMQEVGDEVYKLLGVKKSDVNYLNSLN